MIDKARKISKKYGIPIGTVKNRLNYGWTEKEIISARNYKSPRRMRRSVQMFLPKVEHLKRDDQIRKLKSYGCVLEDIGEHFGITKQAVSKICKKSPL